MGRRRSLRPTMAPTPSTGSRRCSRCLALVWARMARWPRNRYAGRGRRVWRDDPSRRRLRSKRAAEGRSAHRRSCVRLLSDDGGSDGRRASSWRFGIARSMKSATSTSPDSPEASGLYQPIHNDGWQIDACPVNGPALAARGRNIAIAWFTATGDQGRVCGVLLRHRRTFGAPIRLDDVTSFGRVDVDLLDEGSAVRGVDRVRRRKIGFPSPPRDAARRSVGFTSGLGARVRPREWIPATRSSRRRDSVRLDRNRRPVTRENSRSCRAAPLTGALQHPEVP